MVTAVNKYFQTLLEYIFKKIKETRAYNVTVTMYQYTQRKR